MQLQAEHIYCLRFVGSGQVVHHLNIRTDRSMFIN